MSLRLVWVTMPRCPLLVQAHCQETLLMTRPRDPRPQFNRRDLLRSATAAGLIPALKPLADVSEEPTAARRDLTRTENEKAGTTDWMLQNTRVDPKTKYRCPWIEGYCSHTSIRAGETLSIMV